MAQRMFNVLFVCTGNSARSILAECAMNRWGLGKFRGYSAGSHAQRADPPDGARRCCGASNYSTDALRSKDWAEFARRGGPPLDFVFTRLRPGGRRGLPGLARPADDGALGGRGSGRLRRHRGQAAPALSRRLRHARNRIKIFARLPIRSLDRLSLQRPAATRSARCAKARGPSKHERARFDLPGGCVAEALGTALLLAAVIGSGIMAERLAGGNVGAGAAVQHDRDRRDPGGDHPDVRAGLGRALQPGGDVRLPAAPRDRAGRRRRLRRRADGGRPRRHLASRI